MAHPDSTRGGAMPQVVDKLRGLIGRNGPIPFELFMETALYDDGGFFATGPVRSSEIGDFLTSPEVSPWFGRTLGHWLDAAAANIADPTLVEVGAGSGSLLQPLLKEADTSPDVWAVEASPVARAALRGLLGKDRVLAGLDGMPTPVSGVILANELLDNLPVSLAVRRDGGWEEHQVACDDDGFVFVPTPVRPSVAAWAGHFGGNVPEGGIVEVQLAAGEWLRRVIRMVGRGVILLIDYGGTTEELEPRRQLGTLRTYRGHHLGPDPLLEPGRTDITVDVNFTALSAVAAAAGAKSTLQRQDDFLATWGLRAVVRDLRHRELELARHGETMPQLQARTERIAAETLLHPRGLGDFRVLTIEV